MAVVVKLLNLFSRELLVGGGLGLLWGVALVAVYQLNRKRKAERGQLVGGRGARLLACLSNCLPRSREASWPRFVLVCFLHRLPS